jgi:hypothetical protein
VLDLLLFPKRCPQSKRHYYSYTATLDGKEIISGSHDPEHALRGVSALTGERAGLG